MQNEVKQKICQIKAYNQALAGVEQHSWQFNEIAIGFLRMPAAI